MTVAIEQVGKYLGKTLEDSMGRPVGKLVGLTADVKGEVTAIQVAHSDGEVAQYQITVVKVLEDKLILQQNWRVEAEGLKREREIITRRKQALDLLLKDGDIEQVEFDEQRTRYEDLEKDIKEQCENLLGTLKQVEWKLDQQINDLQGALTNNKMLYSSSEIDEQTYQTVTESIRSGLEIARKERQDLDNIRDHLSTIEPMHEKSTIPTAATQKSPSSDVVVIKINELA